jgi:hypothetical protein
MVPGRARNLPAFVIPDLLCVQIERNCSEIPGMQTNSARGQVWGVVENRAQDARPVRDRHFADDRNRSGAAMVNLTTTLARNEQVWWTAGIDPVKVARRLWQQTRLDDRHDRQKVGPVASPGTHIALSRTT